MDAVNWLVHGKHGDTPECACPVITSYVIRGNDAMPDDVRQNLLPYLHRIAGSRSKTHQVARTRILALGALRVCAPRALDLAGLHDHAATLRSLPDNVDITAAVVKCLAAVRPARRRAKATAKTNTEAAAARIRAETTAWMVTKTAAAAWAEAARTMTEAEETKAWTMTMTTAEAADAAKATAETITDIAAWTALKAAEIAATMVDTVVDAVVDAAAWEMEAWGDYFVILNAVLNAGPQGEPWSADQIEIGSALYRSANGAANIGSMLSLGDATRPHDGQIF